MCCLSQLDIRPHADPCMLLKACNACTRGSHLGYGATNGGNLVWWSVRVSVFIHRELLVEYVSLICGRDGRRTGKREADGGSVMSALLGDGGSSYVDIPYSNITEERRHSSMTTVLPDDSSIFQQDSVCCHRVKIVQTCVMTVFLLQWNKEQTFEQKTEVHKKSTHKKEKWLYRKIKQKRRKENCAGMFWGKVLKQLMIMKWVLDFI